MENKSAVEWLVEKWSTQGTLHSSDISQAKEMEKEQKCHFANDYADQVMAGMMKRAEEYLELEYKFKTDWITICVEVDRRGIGEGNMVLHYEFNVEPTREEILALLESEDVGYDDRYCKFDYYRIN